ncbi:zinc finger protein [Acrodontium crateriforme]|uniref:Zinc finger protein n=1 Tax=Acrodontium crateriforme TaxID=150365 RepID=A0AAQ3MA42_9PEZI|nr:zinc finger protein [Acrodontium crateriforme]
MDGRQSDYTQSGLTSPYAPYNRHQSEGFSADQSSAVQYTPTQDYKPANNFSSSATPNSDYLPSSTRSFEGQQQPRYAGNAQSHAAMAQTSSPSLSVPDGSQPNGHEPHNMKSNEALPIDPSIAQSSPTYPPPHNYSPYPSQHEMPQYPGQPMPAYGRPEWAGHYQQQQQQQQQPMGYHSPAASSGAAAPNMMAAHIPRPPQGGHPLSTVYSFVPIPGAQQHKRPRRRYEEIERMYKCGWNGCEKAYGTLNHLNAHVTMQSHGTKRTPEEFKEIRKEWKAKKKEEESQRKQDEERQRQEAAISGDNNTQAQPGYGQQHMMAQQMGGPQLPPIGYSTPGNPSQYPQQQQHVEGAPQYSNVYGGQGYPPQSPYAQGGLPYQQRA